MNQRLMNEAETKMAEAEVLAQEIAELGRAVPVDPEAIRLKYAEYGALFVEASAAVADASYADPD